MTNTSEANVEVTAADRNAAAPYMGFSFRRVIAERRRRCIGEDFRVDRPALPMMGEGR